MWCASPREKKRNFKYLILHYPFVQDRTKDGREHHGAEKMQKSKRDLAGEREHERLTGKDWPDSETGYRVVEKCSHDAEAQEILDRCATILKEEMRGETHASLRKCRHEGPDAPAARDRVKKRNTHKAEQKAS